MLEEVLAEPVEAPTSDAMVVLAARVLGDAGWPGVGVAVRPVVIVQRHNDGQRLGHVDLRVLSPLRLAVQVAHRSGVTLGQPVVQLGGMWRRTRVRDSTRYKPELASPLLQRGCEVHGSDAGASAGLRVVPGTCASSVINRAPRLYVTYDQAHSSRTRMRLRKPIRKKM